MPLAYPSAHIEMGTATLRGTIVVHNKCVNQLWEVDPFSGRLFWSEPLDEDLCLLVDQAGPEGVLVCLTKSSAVHCVHTGKRKCVFADLDGECAALAPDSSAIFLFDGETESLLKLELPGGRVHSRLRLQPASMDNVMLFFGPDGNLYVCTSDVVSVRVLKLMEDELRLEMVRTVEVHNLLSPDVFPIPTGVTFLYKNEKFTIS